MLISSPRIPTPIPATVAAIALLYGVIVPKLPQESEVKPEKYTLVGLTWNDL